MSEHSATNKQQHSGINVIDRSIYMPSQLTVSEYGSNGGQSMREDNFWITAAKIIAKVIAPVAFSLSWAFAQLGWIFGPATMIIFFLVTLYTSTLLLGCSRDTITNRRNHTYTDTVASKLSKVMGKVCKLILCLYTFGVTVSCTTEAARSMRAIFERLKCFHNPCHKSLDSYAIAFGILEIFLSQIPRFDQLWWLPTVAAVVLVACSSIGVALGIAKVRDTGKLQGTGMGIGTMTKAQNIWTRLQALGLIAFACSSFIHPFEIEDSSREVPAKANTMKKATLLGVGVTTLFYLVCACTGYAAFGDSAPKNLLTDCGFHRPDLLVCMANAMITFHLILANQLHNRALFAFVEKKFGEGQFRESQFLKKEIKIPIPYFEPFKLNLFQLISRTSLVTVATITSMLIPLSSDMDGILGAVGFGMLAVFIPIDTYIAHEKTEKWSKDWVWLRILSIACIIISIAAAAGSVVGMVHDIKGFRPFKTRN